MTPWAFQLEKNGVFESDNTVKATILNDHFKSFFTQEDDTLPQLPPSSIPPPHHSQHYYFGFWHHQITL